MIEQFDWDLSDRYISNNGDGPLTARILACTDKEITLERWKGKRSTKFTLPLEFFLSSRCGWEKHTPAHEE